jgi:glycosyltransferase involved in cell wall biosynthesis
MRRIAIFHPSSELYGADRILVHAVNAMPRDVHPVVYLRERGPLVPFLRTHAPQAEVRIVPNMPVIYRAIFTPRGIVRFLDQWLRFGRWLRFEHTFEGFAAYYINTLSCSPLLPLVKRTGVPVFLHVHEIIERPRSVGRFTAWLAARYADRVICVSEAVRQHLQRCSSDVRPKAIVLHNGIDALPSFPPTASDVVRFTLFGRLKPEKGQWYLLEALRLLPPAALAHARFTLMGGAAPGQEHVVDELRALIHERGLDQQVGIVGFSADITQAMSATDVCLVPSLMKDPFPTTVLEAMSAGRPVITTNHGGAREAMLDGLTGFLVPPDDPRVLADRILRYVNDRSLIGRQSICARERFASHFTRAAFAQRWRLVISALLPPEPSRARTAVPAIGKPKAAELV